jgi:tetratricopeptide (TPR) repeat protein
VKFACAFSLLALFASSGIAPAQTTPDLHGESPAEAAVTSSTTQQSTSAQQRIEAAKQQIETHPKDPQLYVELALALIGRARETENPAYYHNAEQAILAGVALAPNDFQLAKAHVALLLGRREFAEAKVEATALNHRTPDDVTTYGYLAEADIALGEYQDAEQAAQWMLNLLPNNVPGLLIGAQLRDLYGDPDGALELLNQAYSETPSTENEQLAWIANQIAEVEIGSGKLDQASEVLGATDRLVAAYPYTLHNLARVRFEQRRYSESIALLLREQKATPSDTEVLYQLARVEEFAGQSSEAAAKYAEFETAAKALVNKPANVNRELIFYYADHVRNWPQALSVAQHEIATRHDVWTLDAYAWALYGNGEYTDADVEMQKALPIGVRSAQLFEHAGNIALKLGKQAEAARYFEASLQLHPASEHAADARGELGYSAPSQIASLSSAPRASDAEIASQPPNTPRADSSAPGTAQQGANANSVSSTSLKPKFAAIEANGLGDTADNFQPVPAALLVPRPTATARGIRTMQSRVARSPNDAKGYAGLGAAFFQLARETGDVENYGLAEQSLTKSLELVSTDVSAASPLATMAEVCMGEHRFQDALVYAERALSLGSGDLSSFAIAGDAYADMGEYDKAANAYSRLTTPDKTTPQWSASYVRDSRTAYLKFISGDTDGAFRLMQSAVAAGSELRLPKENLAWLYFELGEYSYLKGDTAAANNAYLAALTIHPGDYRALAGLGKVRAGEGKGAEAITLYKSAIAVVPMPTYIAELGDLYARTGDAAEAKKQYQLVEYIGLLGHINQVLHNRDLALFYADHDTKLAQSLALARKEFEVRHDVYTWDALAWALYKNGKYQDAQDAIRHALRFGTKDPMLLFHAGMISSGLGENVQAQDQLAEAIRINPHFHVIYAEVARKQLALLQTQLQLTANGAKSNAQ